jgi:RNA polymerase sigma factor (sigma-70 family)
MSRHEPSRHQPEPDRFEIDINALRHLPLAEAQDWIAKYFVDFLATKVFPRKYRLQDYDFEDCGQEVHSVYRRKRHTFRFLTQGHTLDAFVGNEGGFRRMKAWLYRTFNNYCHKHLAHKKRMVLVPLNALERATVPPDPVVAKELSEELHKIIRGFRDRPRFVFTEHHFMGTALFELAERCNVPVNTVKGWLHRSREEIREKLIALFGDDFLCDSF